MKRIIGCGAAALLMGTSVPVLAQERPTYLPPLPGDTVAPADTVASENGPARRIGLAGALARDLPFDDAGAVRRILPGYTESSAGLGLHRSRFGYLATYVDGVPVRTSTGAPGLIPPLDALGSTALTTGALSASRQGPAVIDFTTRFAPATWMADARVLSDALSPGEWSESRTRFDFAVGGPVPGVTNLRAFAAGVLAADQHPELAAGTGPVWLASGVDTSFVLARTAMVSGSTDSVRVAVPNYTLADPRTLPLGSTGSAGFAGGLSFVRGSGSYALRYHRSSARGATRALDQLYNPDAWRGADDVSQMISLTLRRSLPFGLTGDAALAHQRFDVTRGMLDPAAAVDDTEPLLGIRLGRPGFIFGDRSGRPSEAVLLALRSGVLPYRALTFTTDNQVGLRQGVAGVSQSLRLNPYAARSGFPISGLGAVNDPAGDWASERRWYGRGAVSRSFGASWVQAGLELDRTEVSSFTLPLADGVPRASLTNGSQTAGFIHGGTSFGNLVVNAGVRIDRFGTDALLPRVPGFSAFIPDSLRGDAYMLAAGSEPWEQRLQPVIDCGGAATAANRTNPVTGALVCKDNFLPIPDHTVSSPRVGLAWERARLAARASYGSYVQPVAPVAMTIVDLGTTTTATMQPADTDPVREKIAEIGLRVSTFGRSWIDVTAFHLDVTNAVSVRTASFVNPVTGTTVYLPVPVNGASEVTVGVELTTFQAIAAGSGLLASVAFSQSGAGSGGSDLDDPIRASTAAWFDFTPLARSGLLSGVVRDLSFHATGSYVGGGRFTRLANVGNGQLVGRFQSGFGGGSPAEDLLASTLPARRMVDLRIAKGLRVKGVAANLVADLRNPFGIANTHTVFAETGTTENRIYQDRTLAAEMSRYSGLGTLQDMVIDDWTTENVLNRHMLRRAESRFGNGDGIFSVAEMSAAVSSYLELRGGSHWFTDSPRQLRLGVDLRF